MIKITYSLIALVALCLSCAPVNYNYNPEPKFCFYFRNSYNVIDSCEEIIIKSIGEPYPSKMPYIPNEPVIEKLKNFLEEIDFLTLPENLNREDSYHSFQYEFRIVYGEIDKCVCWNSKEPENGIESRIRELQYYMNRMLFESPEYQMLPEPELQKSNNYKKYR